MQRLPGCHKPQPALEAATAKGTHQGEGAKARSDVPSRERQLQQQSSFVHASDSWCVHPTAGQMFGAVLVSLSLPCREVAHRLPFGPHSRGPCTLLGAVCRTRWPHCGCATALASLSLHVVCATRLPHYARELAGVSHSIQFFGCCLHEARISRSSRGVWNAGSRRKWSACWVFIVRPLRSTQATEGSSLLDLYGVHL